MINIVLNLLRGIFIQGNTLVKYFRMEDKLQNICKEEKEIVYPCADRYVYED